MTVQLSSPGGGVIEVADESVDSYLNAGYSRAEDDSTESSPSKKPAKHSKGK